MEIEKGMPPRHIGFDKYPYINCLFPFITSIFSRRYTFWTSIALHPLHLRCWHAAGRKRVAKPPMLFSA